MMLPADRQIDLWYVFSDSAADPRLLDQYQQMLAPDEREQWQRFRVEKAKHQYLVTRALIRTVLSSYTGAAPQSWVFRRNPYGKPSVIEPDAQGLDFNLSHTDGVVVCGVTSGRQLGVDVERPDRKVEHLELARRFFAPAEARVIAEGPAEERPARFFRFWTLKESYIKARGMGLSIPLDAFAFEVGFGRPPRIHFTEPGLDEASRWQFMQLQMEPGYQIAVAVRAAASETMHLCVRETLPLHRQSEARVLEQNRSNAWCL